MARTALTITAEARSVLTRQSGVHSLVGVGHDVVGQVQELSQVLETRVRQGVVEVAPADHRLTPLATSCRSSSRNRETRGTGAA